MVLGSNAVFVCVVFFLVLGSFAKSRSLVERCKSGWGGRKGRGGGGGKQETSNEEVNVEVNVDVDVEVELTVIGSNAGEEKNKEVVVQSVVNPLLSRGAGGAGARGGASQSSGKHSDELQVHVE